MLSSLFKNLVLNELKQYNKHLTNRNLFNFKTKFRLNEDVINKRRFCTEDNDK